MVLQNYLWESSTMQPFLFKKPLHLTVKGLFLCREIYLELFTKTSLVFPHFAAFSLDALHDGDKSQERGSDPPDISWS